MNADIRAIYDNLVLAPLSPPGALRSLVHTHRSRAQTALESRRDVDYALALALADACLAMLERWGQCSVDQQHEIQAACLYFADDADESDDFATLDGFDDDLIVVNHVARRIGRTDLLITKGGTDP